MPLAQHRPAELGKTGSCGRREQERCKLKTLNLGGRFMTLLSCRWAEKKADGCVCVSVHKRAGMDGLARSLMIEAPPMSPLILLPQYLPLPLVRLLSWNQPKGRRAKWSVSEEGHPLAWCSGQTLQQRFLCSAHLLVLAHSSGPQHRSGQALANMLLQQPDHFTQDFSVSTVGSN